MIIGRLTGTVAALGTDNILIDVNGVGYVCMAGTRLLSRVHVGETSVLHVETKVNEAAIILYAFGSDEERAWFVRLQDVHGVAGKAAMAILDAITPAELMDAIALGDASVLTRAKGVGKKLAEASRRRWAGLASSKPPRSLALPVRPSPPRPACEARQSRRLQTSAMPNRMPPAPWPALRKMPAMTMSVL
ncbi:hypothetical protein L53_12580 [Hyphomonas sp. L-53-1-40]|nr:hypothetical protein L53_12580 [Hyphomonas sp. L-53-1-40]